MCPEKWDVGLIYISLFYIQYGRWEGDAFDLQLVTVRSDGVSLQEIYESDNFLEVMRGLRALSSCLMGDKRVWKMMR